MKTEEWMKMEPWGLGAFARGVMGDREVGSKRQEGGIG